MRCIICQQTTRSTVTPRIIDQTVDQGSSHYFRARQRPQPLALCAHCLQLLPWSGHYCQRCGQNCAVTRQQLCGRCLNAVRGTPRPLSHPNPRHHLIRTRDSLIDRFYFPCWYQPPIDTMIKALKFGHHVDYAVLLGRLLVSYLCQQFASATIGKSIATTLTTPVPASLTWPQVIIPVPLHPQRLYLRGYNQALEIARVVAQLLQIPLNSHCLRRVINTKPQTIAASTSRYQNITPQAFAVVPPVVSPDRQPHSTDGFYSSVALIDDVVTSGATVQACAAQLRRAGVQQLQVWCVAKANPQQNTPAEQDRVGSRGWTDSAN